MCCVYHLDENQNSAVQYSYSTAQVEVVCVVGAQRHHKIQNGGELYLSAGYRRSFFNTALDSIYLLRVLQYIDR